MLKTSLKAGQPIAYADNSGAVKDALLTSDYDGSGHLYYLLNTASLAGAVSRGDLWSPGQWLLLEPPKKYVARHTFKQPVARDEGWPPGDLERGSEAAASTLRRTQRSWPYEHGFSGDPVIEGDKIVAWDLYWVRE